MAEGRGGVIALSVVAAVLGAGSTLYMCSVSTSMESDIDELRRENVALTERIESLEGGEADARAGGAETADDGNAADGEPGASEPTDGASNAEWRADADAPDEMLLRVAASDGSGHIGGLYVTADGGVYDYSIPDGGEDTPESAREHGSRREGEIGDVTVGEISDIIGRAGGRSHDESGGRPSGGSCRVYAYRDGEQTELLGLDGSGCRIDGSDDMQRLMDLIDDLMSEKR